MTEAKYTVNGKGEILKDGHTMFTLDVLNDLQRKTWLEAKLKEMQAQVDLVDDPFLGQMRRISWQCPVAVSQVLVERSKQNDKWGEQNHTQYRWLAILMEEVGELSQAMLETTFPGPRGGPDNIRNELNQVAAVALAMIECCNRNKWGE